MYHHKVSVLGGGGGGGGQNRGALTERGDRKWRVGGRRVEGRRKVLSHKKKGPPV